jgi:putative hydrolase of the HAD superfamily
MFSAPTIRSQGFATLISSVLFDLDDTLYEEMAFVRSGFWSVAQHARDVYGKDPAAFYQSCLDVLAAQGRGRVFDLTLEKFGIQDPKAANAMLRVYRTHVPTIQLDEEAAFTLRILRQNHIRTGVLTDGMASVQRLKAQALQLHNLVDIIVYSDDLGRQFWKPNELPFRAALEQLQASPSEAAYIGNDDNKDFLGANRLGMVTIKVARWQIACAEPLPDSQALHTVEKLRDVLSLILPNAYH